MVKKKNKEYQRGSDTKKVLTPPKFFYQPTQFIPDACIGDELRKKNTRQGNQDCRVVFDKRKRCIPSPYAMPNAAPLIFLCSLREMRSRNERAKPVCEAKNSVIPRLLAAGRGILGFAFHFFKKVAFTIFCFGLCFSSFLRGASQKKLPPLSSPSQEIRSVQLGIDRLEASGFAELRGKKVGLIANPASVDSKGKSTIDVLREAKGVQLIALFAPEHGLYGIIKAGDHVANCKDKKTCLPVYSLYGDTRKPTSAMLRGIDVMVYDLQDIGCRSYTFISTLGLVMEAAQENGVQVMALDRPNPLGGTRIEGPRLNPKFRSFVGMFDVPYVHGMTVGELAKWINLRHLKKPCDLKVVEMKNWKREMTWEDTKLRWAPTSPNIPTVESARGYVATGLLGEIGVTNGANEELPFQMITSEGLDAQWFSSKMNALGLKGVKFEPYVFKPTWGRYRQVSTGARLKIDPKAEANLTAIAFYAYPLLKKTFPRRNYFGRSCAVEMFDKLNGSNSQRIALLRGRSPSEIIASWDAGVAKWREERKSFLLYPSKVASMKKLSDEGARTALQLQRSRQN